MLALPVEFGALLGPCDNGRRQYRARERFLVILGALGFYSFQSTLSVVVKHDWIALAASISTGVLGLLLIRSLKDYKPSYGWPRDINILDLLISLTSLGLTVVLRSWILR
jgi:hypothetical protein